MLFYRAVIGKGGLLKSARKYHHFENSGFSSECTCDQTMIHQQRYVTADSEGKFDKDPRNVKGIIKKETLIPENEKLAEQLIVNQELELKELQRQLSQLGNDLAAMREKLANEESNLKHLKCN